MEKRRRIVFRLSDNGNRRRRDGTSQVDLQEIMERDELANNQPHTDYGMFNYKL